MILALVLHVALITDDSRSTRSNFEAAKKEQQAMITALPDGSHLTILTAGSSVRRIFDGNMDPAARADAARAIAGIEAKEWYSDLVAGLREGIAATAGAARRQVWLYTDGQLDPKPGTAYRGRAFGPMLNEMPIPNGTRVVIRLIAGGKLEGVNRSGVAVMKEPPDWKGQFRVEASPHPTPEKTKPWTWRGASVAALLAGLIGLALVVKRMREARERSALEAPVAAREPEKTKPAERTAVRFKLLTKGAPPLELSPEGASRLVIGRSALADLELSDLDGSVRLRLEGPGAVLENVDCGTVFVGAKRIPAGQTQALPMKGFEFRVGAHPFVMFPEEFRTGGEA